MALASAEPRGTVPRLSHTTVPPRPIVTRDRSNPVSVIETWWPLGGVGGGELDVEVEVDVEVLVVELELDVVVELELDVVVELELDVVVELELDVVVELELDVDEVEVDVDVLVVDEVEVDVDVLDVEVLTVGDGVGEDDAHVGGIGSGAGRT